MLSTAPNICARCIRAQPHLSQFSRLYTLQPVNVSRTFRLFAKHRQFVHPREYQPFAPPSPGSLPKPAPPRTFPRTRRWSRRFAYLVLTAAVVYAADKRFYASVLTRSSRAFAVAIIASLDYKINFRPNPPLVPSIAALHARNAQRLFDVLAANGGLYLKIGQAIAMQSAILPPEFQKMFSKMFDDAPQNPWEDVEKVIREDFGKSPEEVFGVSFDGDVDHGVMEKSARASASIAQVHWARSKDGREIAIKIQKREIAQQTNWDLWAFKVISRVYSWYHDLPLYTLVPFIVERLSLETDFLNEAKNSERMAELVAGEPRLSGRVYIPKVYHDMSSRRVMTAEWIEGIRLWDKASLTAPWEGGFRQGSPGAGRKALPPLPLKTIQDDAYPSAKLKPDREQWRGENRQGGLGLSLKDVMTTMVDLFSAQMFLWGYLHCDPHPGNIFIRRLPSGKPELVLIDHGLYINMKPAFRHQYSQFWKSLLIFDNATLQKIVEGWGIRNADIFASATLMRPYKGGDNSTSSEINKGLKGDSEAERAYYAQQKMRSGIREILADEEKWPQELIFIGRNLRIVQGNNQFLGSPVNRIRITGEWASRSLVDSPDLSWLDKLRSWRQHLLFRFVLFSTDVIFYVSKLKQLVGAGGGMEDDMEAQMKHIAKDFGVELNHGVFEG